MDAIASVDDAWNTAYRTNDRAALERILADDLTAIAANGQLLTKADILVQVAANPWPFTEARFHTERSWQGDDTGVVIGRLTGRGRIGDEEFALDQWYNRVYVLHDGRWQAVAVQVTAVQE